MTDIRQLDEIAIVDRHRRDLGDIASLVVSIKTVGLINPVTITPDGRLIAGHRRLEAYRQLGYTSVPVRVVDSLTSARDLLVAERDENTCRVEMKPSELVALGLALEELEEPKAMERQKASVFGGVHVNTTDEPTGRTRDIVGQALGISGASYWRARSVVAAIQDADPNVRAIAEEAVREMDATGRFHPAAEKVRAVRKPKPPLAKRAARHAIHRHGRRINPDRIINESIYMLDGIVNGLQLIEDISSLDTEKRLAWLDAIREPLRAINRFAKELRG